HEQPDNDEFDSANETDDFTIKDGAEFPKRNNTGVIIRRYFVCENSKERQSKKKIVSEDQRDRESKKVGCQWQLNVECQKNSNTIVIVINKLVEAYNHPLALHRKEFAPSLHMLSQEVLDEIKFLTQECGFGTKAQFKTIQAKLEREAKYQRLSEYKNTLLTRGLPSIQSVFFEPVQNAIKKYLILESASMQNTQILQSVLYHACLYEVSNNSILFPSAHEYAEGYLEDEYDALQASLENIINMVNCDNILEMSYNAKFDIKLIPNCWYTDSMQTSNCSIITGTDAADIMKFDTNKEMNQVIAIRGPNIYQASIHACVTQKQEYAHRFGIAKSGLKFAFENGLINEFVKLIVKFIENHSEVATNKHVTIDITQIENPKKLKHKGHPKLFNSIQSTLQDLNTNQNLNLRQDKLRRIIETDAKSEYIEELLSKKWINKINEENSVPK
ncbi:17762_t:CDS:2, partial [Dentiscutata erythropus]